MPCALYNTQYFKRFSLETSLPLSYINTYTHIQIHLCSEFEPPEVGRPALGEGDPVNSPLSSLRSTLSFILSSIPSSILGRMQCRGGNEIQYRRPVLTGHLQDSSDTDSLYNLVGSSEPPPPPHIQEQGLSGISLDASPSPSPQSPPSPGILRYFQLL